MTLGGGGLDCIYQGKIHEKAFCWAYDGFCELKPVVSRRAGHRFSVVAEVVL